MRWRLLLLTLLLVADPASATLEFTVTADTMLGSELGTLVRLVEDGTSGETLFVLEFAGQIQVRARRPDGGEWEIWTDRRFLCPVAEMQLGQTWKFLRNDPLVPRQATVAAFQTISVPAGEFQCWRVDVANDDEPDTVEESIWFSAEVGIVRLVEWELGVPVTREELDSLDVTGEGFFPVVIGNRWSYVDDTVPARTGSFGALKDRFSN